MSEIYNELKKLAESLKQTTERLDEILNINNPMNDTGIVIRGMYCSGYYSLSNGQELWEISLHAKTAPKHAEMHQGFFRNKSDVKKRIAEIDRAMLNILKKPIQTT